MKQLSIVIPAYNEEDAIIPTLEAVLGTIASSGIDAEIIVVNDGSTDRTRQKLDDYLAAAGSAAAGQGILKVLNHERNKGYGASLKTGIRSASAPLCAITDADGTYPHEQIPEMLRILRDEDQDMVVGMRPFKKLPLVTKPAKWVITRLAEYLAGEKIKDLNSGLRVFKRDVAMQYFGIISNGFSFTTTITLAMMTNDYRVRYYEIDYLKREGKSKIRPVKDTLNFIQLIIRTVIYFDPLRVFIPASVILFLAGLATWIAGLFFGLNLDITFVVLFIASVQMLTTGMIADMIDKRVK